MILLDLNTFTNLDDPDEVDRLDKAEISGQYLSIDLKSLID